MSIVEVTIGAEAQRESNPDVGSFVQTAEIKTNYHDSGSGHAVLLLHGSGPGVTAWANWRKTLPALAERFRVLAPDLAGFGYSECPTGSQFEMKLWVRQLAAFLDALHLDRVSVVGNSFGGAVALALAMKLGERVDRLVLMGSAGVEFELTPGLDAVWGYQPSYENMSALMRWFAFDQSLITEDIVAMRYRSSIRAGVQEAFAAMFPAPRQEGIRKLAQPEAALRALRHDCLLIHGREDRVIPVDTSMRLHDLIRQSELHVFGECGHWVQIEKAQRFSVLVAGFLQP